MFWSRPGAEIFVVVVVIIVIMHAEAARRPDFIYTKNPKSQNQHGRNLQGQSAISFKKLPCFGPRVALFSRTRAVGAKAIDAFFNFRTF